MTPKKITLHNTDNQMPAHNEISYMRNNNNQVSYHVAIDEKEAIQGLSYYRNGWHSGDGGNGYGNRNTIGVEICRNYDRSRKTTNLVEPLKSQYSKAEQNAIKFVAQLCIDLGIIANNNNIKTHNDWNGKWCPSKILNEKRLQSVKNGIIAEYNRLKGNKVKPGWIKDNIGWWYRNTDGSYPKSTWEKISNEWYYFNNKGYMVTGWEYINKKWHYFKSNGHMETGWIRPNKSWYYLNANGEMQTGWTQIHNTWFYMDRSGRMQTGWLYYRKNWFYLDDRGGMRIGWYEVDSKWYYFNEKGYMQTGLLTLNDKHYFLQRNGALITDEVIQLEANKHGHLK